MNFTDILFQSYKKIFIFEVGQNHEGDMDKARMLMDECKSLSKEFPEILFLCKFQLYDTDKIFDGTEPFYEQTKKAELSYEQYLSLLAYGKTNGIIVFASVFDDERLGWLISLADRRYPTHILKIASRSATDIITLRRLKNILETLLISDPDIRRNIIVSTGMKHWQQSDYRHFFGTIPCRIWMLECQSRYPATYSIDDELKITRDLRRGIYHGISDHSIGTHRLSYYFGMEACKIFEKHICLDYTQEGPDIKCSLTPLDIRLALVQAGIKYKTV